MSSITKKCSCCGFVKTADEFYKNGKHLNSACKTCQKERYKKWVENNRERYDAIQKKWRDANKEKVSAKRRESDYFRVRRLTYQYGITIDDFNNMKEKQGSVCATCGKERKLVVDHDHESGSVRGLLCQQCNTALGLIRDNKGVLQRMIEYLSK